MSRSADAGGHGSTICTTLSLSTALPPNGEMASRRATYSEQPARATSTSVSAPARTRSVDRIEVSPRHVEHMAGEWLVAGGGNVLLGRGRRAGAMPRHLGL